MTTGMASSALIEKPCLQFLIGFVLINAYVPGVVGASIPTGWLFLVAITPLLLFVDIRITNAHIYGSLFILYAFLSLLWTPSVNVASIHFLQWVALAGVFCIGSSVGSIKWFIIGLAVGLLPSDIIATLQHYYKYTGVYTLSGNTAGLFVNKNLFCEVSVAILISLVVFRLWFYIPFTLPALFYVHSRGALLGLIAGLSIVLYKWDRRWFTGLVIVSVLGALVLYSRNFAVPSILERFDLWADTIRGFKVFGNGIGSFELTYPYYAVNIDTSLARPKFAHNDLLELIYEIGIGIIFVIIFIYTVLKSGRYENVILYAIGVMSLFNYVIHVPVIGFIWVLVAGYVSRNLLAIRINGDISRSCILERT